MTPYFSPRSPPEFSATLPPMRADAHRAGIRRIEQAVPRRRLVDGHGRDARLRAQREVPRIDVEDRVHLRQAEHDAPSLGTLPPLRPVPDPRVTIGSAWRRRELHAARDIVGGVRKHDRRRHAARSAAVPSKP